MMRERRMRLTLWLRVILIKRLWLRVIKPGELRWTRRGCW